MQRTLDDAIQAHVLDGSDVTLRALHIAFMESSLFIPLGKPVREVVGNWYDIPVLCVMDRDRGGAIAAFMTFDHMLEWKPEGCLYTNVSGRSLLTMAIGMPDISEVLVNPGGVPRGRIPRADFAQMLSVYSASLTPDDGMQGQAG